MRESTITTHCYQTLENERLIRILQSKDKAGETGVYDCLKKIFYETLIYLLVEQKTDRPIPDIQRTIAEEAFQEAVMALLENVRTGRFKAEAAGGKSAGSVGYFFTILRNKFLSELRRGHNTKHDLFQEKRHGKSDAISPDMPAYNRKDGMSVILQTAIKKLKDKCRRYMQWQYIEGKNTEDIILLADDLPGTVRKDLANCRKKLLESIQEDYDIDI